MLELHRYSPFCTLQNQPQVLSNYSTPYAAEQEVDGRLVNTTRGGSTLTQ